MALLLSSKYLCEDGCCTNSFWAAQLRIPLMEVSAMEREFLGSIKHRLYVDNNEYSRWLQALEAELRVSSRPSVKETYLPTSLTRFSLSKNPIVYNVPYIL